MTNDDIRKLFERLIEFTHDAVYRYTYEGGVILMANQGLVDVLDLDCHPEDLVGKRLRDVLVYTEEEGTVRHAADENGQVRGFEYHFKTLKGEDRWVVHDSFIMTDPDTKQLVVEAIVRNITERKQAEEEIKRANEALEERVQERTSELEAANRELEAFAYSVSHDLRAPLRHVEGFGTLLLENYSARLDETGQDYLRRMLAGTKRMGDLIDAILKISRLTRSPMRLAPVDLSGMAGEIARELMESEPDRRVEFVIEPGLTAKADPDLLRDALYNLLGNAWKFTAGREAARIEVGRTRKAGQHAFCVRDNGIGFDMKYGEKLFKPFQRLHGPGEFPGTGIGLASVQRVIARHGGSLWAEGAVDGGATFTFTLGRQRPAHGET